MCVIHLLVAEPCKKLIFNSFTILHVNWAHTCAANNNNWWLTFFLLSCSVLFCSFLICSARHAQHSRSRSPAFHSWDMFVWVRVFCCIFYGMEWGNTWSEIRILPPLTNTANTIASKLNRGERKYCIRARQRLIVVARTEFCLRYIHMMEACRVVNCSWIYDVKWRIYSRYKFIIAHSTLSA